MALAQVLTPGLQDSFLSPAPKSSRSSQNPTAVYFRFKSSLIFLKKAR